MAGRAGPATRDTSKSPGGWRTRILDRLPGFSAGRPPAVVLAALVGAAGGAFAVFFRELVDASQAFFFGWVRGVLAPLLGPYAVLWIPALGGLLVGPLVYFLAREAKGHGVPEVMEAVALRGGRIRPRVILVKAIASAVTIGSGGSTGREGPIVQMGSAIGSVVGQGLRLSERTVKTLVACGAAAGIAATFNAPIAGVIFAHEIILGEFAGATFTLIVIASVVAAAVAHGLAGNQPAFLVPPYELRHPVEFLFYAVLGVLAGAAGVLFIRTLSWFEDRFDGWKGVPPYAKAAVGGVLVGAVGLLVPEVLGVGHGTMDAILRSEGLPGGPPGVPAGARIGAWAGRAPAGGDPGLAVLVLAGLFLFKLLATSLTLGSGGSGGIMSPSLFLGATLGAAVGTLAHGALPSLTAMPGAYALVGMGAVLAATTQAPIQAILIVFEMTRDYRIILALMMACVVAVLVSTALSADSVYTIKLRRRGIRLRAGRDVTVLQRIPVQEAMTAKPVVVRRDWPLARVIRVMQSSRHNGFPVVDENGHLVGVITLADIRNTYPDEPERRLAVAVEQAMTPNPVVAYPDESLAQVLERLGRYDVGRLPVVARGDPRQLLGVITRSDVIKAYNRRVLQQVPGTAGRGMASLAGPA